MTESGTQGSTFTVLLVCTGNVCRSAFAERIGRAFLDDSMGERATAFRLVSAGTQGVVGSGMHPDSALVLQGFGGEPDGFVARQLTDGLVMDADLVLTMTRAHRSAVLTLAPRALARTFTLREAADIVTLLEPGMEPTDSDWAERARALVKAMATARSRRLFEDHGSRDDSADDIPDPVGRPVEVHQEVGEAIVVALLPILGRLAQPAGEVTA